jgi:hypothetical protein
MMKGKNVLLRDYFNVQGILIYCLSYRARGCGMLEKKYERKPVIDDEMMAQTWKRIRSVRMDTRS